MRRFFPDLAFMALRLRNPRVRLHKYPFISIIYHNLTLHIIMSAVNSFLLHFIRHNHDRNAIVTYLTAIVCNCHIVTDGIELKYTICAKQNGGCNNIFKVFNDNIS